MFESKTCFILGAGASAEVNMPIGSGLASKIGDMLNFQWSNSGLQRGDHAVFNAMTALANRGAFAGNMITSAGREVAEAMAIAPSIDNFLHCHNSRNEYCYAGKLAIVRAIALEEARSKFRRRDDTPFDLWGVTDTWYVSLAQHLFTGVPSSDPASAFKNVSFIDFNYDRCLELFLIRALTTYYQMTQVEAVAIINTLDIIHPYGSLGPLLGPGAVPFGFADCDLIEVVKGIKTFTESTDDDQKVERIRALTKQAETLVFLGFAFHDQNMDLLSEPIAKGLKQTAIRRVYATTKGLSGSDSQVVKGKIGQMLRGRPQKERDDYSIELFDGTCAQLFAEYWRSLSAPVETQASLRSVFPI